MAADPAFIDTNVLVYISRPVSPGHARARIALGQLEKDGAPLWISRQVMREYLAVVTRPQVTAPPLAMASAVGDVRRFRSSFQVAEDGAPVLDRLLFLLDRYPGAGKQVHDTNIVATMVEHGLLTFNTADFRRFSGVIELEPLPVP